MPKGRPGRRWESLGLLGKEPKQAAAHMPRGLYLYGGVGTGKTMLMDLLVNSAPPHFKASSPSPDQAQGHAPFFLVPYFVAAALGSCAGCCDETHNPTQLLFIPITPWRTTGNMCLSNPGPSSLMPRLLTRS